MMVICTFLQKPFKPSFKNYLQGCKDSKQGQLSVAFETLKVLSKETCKTLRYVLYVYKLLIKNHPYVKKFSRSMNQNKKKT